MSESITLPVIYDGKQIAHLEIDLAKPSPGKVHDGCCVLFLHGFGTHRFGDKAEYYREQSLSTGLAYCAFDFQGHGGSGGEFRDLTLSRNLADAAMVHDYLISRGYSKIILIGSSMGGVTGLWHAVNFRKDIAAGLFLAPALNMTATAFMRTGDEIHNWKESGILKFEHRGIDRELAWDFIMDLETYPARKLAEKFCLPSLIVQGKRDVLIPWEFTQAWTGQCCDKVAFHLFEDGDHLLLEQKEEIWKRFHELLVKEEILNQRTA